LVQLTADDPDRRPSAEQARVALRRIADGASAAVAAPLAGTVPGDRDRAGKRGRLLGVAAAVVAVLAVAAGVLTGVVGTRADGAAPAGPAAGPPTSTAPDGAVIGDVTTADPCSLVDPGPLHAFGAASFLRDEARFAACAVSIARPDGTTATYSLTFQTQAETEDLWLGLRQEEAGYTVVSFEPADGYCDELVELPDRNVLRLAAQPQRGWTGTQDMCAIVGAARATALARLEGSGVGTRPPLTDGGPLAGIPACGLLTPADLVAVIPDVTQPQARFADWGCDWASTSGDSTVELVYYRSLPLSAYLGTRADFAGRPGLVHPAEGACWIPFVQRSYSVEGSERLETVQLTYSGPGPQAELCRAATALATAAAGRLPPPG
jgi:hypothetical protein